MRRKTPNTKLKVAFDDANIQRTRGKGVKKTETPWTDENATETLNARRRRLLLELQNRFFPMKRTANALAVVLVSGDERTSEHDWAAICLDINEHKDAKVLALNEEIGKEGEEKETPLTIDRNAKVEEIDSRAIMDYLIFDRGSVLDLEEGEKEEKEDIGECAFGPGSASALKKKYRMNEGKVKRAVMSVQDWGLEEGVESRKFYPIFIGNDDVNNEYHSDEEDIIGTTMCAKRRRGNTPGSTLVRVIDKDQVPTSDGRRATIPFDLHGGMDDDDKTLSPFHIHGKRHSEDEWRGGESYLCDKLRRHPTMARLNISRFAAEMICRELSNKENNNSKVVSPIDEEEEEENEVQKTPRGGVGEKKKRKLGGNFSLVRTVERG
ncbi:unnamed protein product [Bathycoccus prasinos]